MHVNQFPESGALDGFNLFAQLGHPWVNELEARAFKFRYVPRHKDKVSGAGGRCDNGTWKMIVQGAASVAPVFHNFRTERRIMIFSWKNSILEKFRQYAIKPTL